MNPKDPDDLTDEQIQRVLRMRGFQKMLAYGKLADGIEVLNEEDKMFDSLVTTITNQHSQVRSEESVREFFKLFVQEVEAFTEPLVDADSDEEMDAAEIEDMYVEDTDE